MVEKLVEGEQEWAMVTSKGEVKTTEYTVHNLKPNVNYFFRVSAVNCAGRGEPLEITEPVQAKDILGNLIFDTKRFLVFSVYNKFPLHCTDTVELSMCDHVYFFQFSQRRPRLTQMWQ